MGPMTKKLLCLIIQQFKLDINGYHGIKHWKSVERFGIKIAKKAKTDLAVVRLFAYLHDAKRHDEFLDPEHGKRSARFIKKLYKKGLLDLNKKQLSQLVFACKHHNSLDAKSNDITIQVCWDADRLDLSRIGIMPSSCFLYTEEAKRLN